MKDKKLEQEPILSEEALEIKEGQKSKFVLKLAQKYTTRILVVSVLAVGLGLGVGPVMYYGIQESVPKSGWQTIGDSLIKGGKRIKDVIVDCPSLEEGVYGECLSNRKSSRENAFRKTIDLWKYVFSENFSQDLKKWIENKNDKLECFMPSQLEDKEQGDLSYNDCVDERILVRKYGEKIGKPMASGKRKVNKYSDQTQELLGKGKNILDAGRKQIKKLTDKTTKNFNNLMNRWWFVKKDKERGLKKSNQSSII